MIRGKDFTPFLKGPDRVQIIEDGKTLFIGFWGMIQHADLFDQIQEAKIKDFRATVDIKHKNWESLGLMEPLMPGVHHDYEFRDLTTSIYYNITIEREPEHET